MGEFLTTLNFWHWWVAAMALIILEVFAPGAFMLWLGVAAAVVGFLLLLFPGLPWEAQYALFAVLSVASIAAWLYYRKRHPLPDSGATLNRRGQQYIGRVFTLDEPIVNGVGKVKVDDSTWKVRGADLPAGTRVTVTAVENTVFVVAALETDA